MNKIHFPNFPTTQPLLLKSCCYGGNFTARRHEKLEFLDMILNPRNKKAKEKAYVRSLVCELENA